MNVLNSGKIFYLQQSIQRTIVLLLLLWISIANAFAVEKLPLVQLNYQNKELKLLRAEIAENIKQAGYLNAGKIQWRRYIVKKEDNFFMIMAKVMLDHDTLSSVNSLASLWDLEPGDEWLLPNTRGIAVRMQTERAAEKYKIPEYAIINIPGKPGYVFLPGISLHPDERTYFNLATFLRPVAGRLSSGFGKRKDPFEKKERFHKGIDIACPIGSQVVASAAGKVEFAGRKGGYGVTVIINHGNGYRSLYGHLSKVKIKKGATVKRGETIALSGNTGASTGPHLHFEIHREGKPRRPDFKGHYSTGK